MKRNMMTFKQSIIVAILMLNNSCMFPDPEEVAYERTYRAYKDDLTNTIKANKASKENVLSVVEKMGELLEYASDELRADPETVLKAVKNCTSSLGYASEVLRSDREFILNVLRICVPAPSNVSVDSTDSIALTEKSINRVRCELYEIRRYIDRKLLENFLGVAFIYQSLNNPIVKKELMGTWLTNLAPVYKEILVSTKIAAQGVSAPVINIEVVEDGQNFAITKLYMSGESLQVTIAKENCTVGDVASCILKQLNIQKQEKEEKPVEYIYLVLGDKTFVLSDHSKPLAKFLT